MADWQRDLSALEALGYMLDQQVECDVIFVVEGQKFGAHRSVVEARSSVLMSMLEGVIQGAVEITNVDSHTFRTVLKYLYTDEIEVTESNIFLLLRAAADFKMRHLEKQCTAFIDSCLNANNLCSFANKALEYNAFQFCQRFHEVFSTNTQEVLDSYEFTDLAQDVLSSLLEADVLTVLEVEVFQAVMDWALAQCRQQQLDANGPNIRMMLGDILYKIRFPTMSMRDFSNKVTSVPGLLTDTETCQVFTKMTRYSSDEVICPFSDRFRCRVAMDGSPATATAGNLLSQPVCRHTNGLNQSVGNVLLWWNGSGHDLPRASVVEIIDTCVSLLNSNHSESVIDASSDPALRRDVLQCYNDFANYLQQHPANFKKQKHISEALEIGRKLVQSLGCVS